GRVARRPSYPQGAHATSRSTPAHYSTTIGYTMTRDTIASRPAWRAVTSFHGSERMVRTPAAGSP
ncbi:hypothetical protein ACWCZ5_35515, partial [Streptomyces sp. NPDC001667]